MKWYTRAALDVFTMLTHIWFSYSRVQESTPNVTTSLECKDRYRWQNKCETENAKQKCKKKRQITIQHANKCKTEDESQISMQILP